MYLKELALKIRVCSLVDMEMDGKGNIYNLKNDVEAIENGYDNSYVKRKEFEVAINRIKERGIINNIDLYLMKLNVVFGDGYFYNVQIGFDDNADDRTNFFYSVYNKENGENYIVGASVLQVSFFVILTILTVGSIITNKDDTLVFFKLTIIGVIVFVLLFEGRSKYLYMFLPVFTITAGLLLNKIIFKINNIWRKQ